VKDAARAVIIGGGVGGCAILLNDQPIFWTVVISIALIGAVYYLLVQRTKPAHLTAPEGEPYLEEGPDAPSASTA
jgi:hypothetical protein